MTIEFYGNTNQPRGLGGSSLGQKATQTKIKSMVRSDWHAMRGDGSSPSDGNQKKNTPEIVLAKTAIHKEILDRLGQSVKTNPHKSAGS